MADNRSRLEKYLGMLGSDQMGERAAAALKISELAKAEGKTIPELCLAGTERVVYRDRPGASADEQSFRTRNRQSWDGFNFDWAEMARRAEANRQRDEEVRRRREQRAAEEAAEKRNQFNGAFDDAELSDEERAAARAKRAEARARRKRTMGRDLLNELEAAYESDTENSLQTWEEEFARSVPNQYRSDYELSAKQERTARMIIAKIRRNQGESPI